MANNFDNSYHVVGSNGVDATAILDGFTITGGNADGSGVNDRGGGMFNLDSSPTVTHCTFSGNTTDTGGGALANENSSSPTVTHCTFSGNMASVNGGGMNNFLSSSPTATHCTFSGNMASGDGDGMDSFDSSPTVINCIIWNHNVGNPIFTADPPLPNVSFSNIQGGYPGLGNINADPLFVDADGADNNMGTEDNDLRLSAGSSCIDAADSTAVPANTTDLDGDGNTTEPIPFDLDGGPRFVDDPVTADTGVVLPPLAVVDMGPYEYALASIDIGLRLYDGTATIGIACQPQGTLTSPLRIAKNGITYGVVLVNQNDLSANGIVIQTASGPRAMAKLP